MLRFEVTATNDPKAAHIAVWLQSYVSRLEAAQAVAGFGEADHGDRSTVPPLGNTGGPVSGGAQWAK